MGFYFDVVYIPITFMAMTLTKTNTDTRTITLCITSYNRTDLTVRSFSNVLNHPNIGEVVIVDDCSTEENYQKLRQLLISLASPKIRLFRNINNLDCYRNKRRAVELAKNDWVILLDSDNIIDNGYVNSLLDINSWIEKVIYAPDFAMPHFDYTNMSGMAISRSTVSEVAKIKGFDALINTANYFFNKKAYLSAYKEDIDPYASDTCYLNYNHLCNGGSILVVPNLRYQHDVHDGSHYKEHNHKSNHLFDELIGKMKVMSNEPELKLSVVTFKPMGRLGNFMFEFAAAYSYAKKHGLEFSMPKHTNDEKWNPIYFHTLQMWYDFKDVIVLNEKKYFRYDELEFKPEWKFGKEIILEGYFQNPKYITESKESIIEFLRYNKNYYMDEVSIHIRRGDYLLYTDKHPAFSSEFIEESMAKMDPINRDLVFKVYSDDIPWCRAYFGAMKFDGYDITFVEGQDELQDMIGISQCGAGHINSSSTFSWWGAYLGLEEAEVYTPKVWLLHKHANEWTDEIIPESFGWHKI